MTVERWRRIEEIFHAAMERPPEERPALLDQACGGDAGLRRQIEVLLACDGRDDSVLDSAVQGAAQVLARQTESMIGRNFGAYRVIGLLGHGRMGTVYLSVRNDDQYQKKVAIKLVKRGMDTDGMLRRFRQERHILARLRVSLAGFLRESNPAEAVRLYNLSYRILGNCWSRRLSACSGNECWRGLARLEDEIVEPGAFTRGELGDHLSSVGERERAASAYLQAIESAQRAVNERPQDMELRRELADCYERLGQFHIRTREWSPAGDWYAKSLEVWATWTRWGVSSVYNVRRQQQAAAWMARCDTALKQRRGDTFFFFFRLRS